MGNGQVDMSGMTLHRSSNQAGQQESDSIISQPNHGIVAAECVWWGTIKLVSTTKTKTSERQHERSSD